MKLELRKIKLKILRREAQSKTRMEIKIRMKKVKTTTTETDEIQKQDNETQYDKHTNEKGELVIMTKKSVVSMTTAAITSQPLEVVTTVTNQLPAALEKAREKGIFERLSSKDSLVGKEEDKPKESVKTEPKEIKTETKDPHHGKDKEKEKNGDKRPPPKPAKSNHDRPLFTEDHIRLRPLQPPYDNPQVERVKQKIDDILKEPEISPENILTASAKSREAKNTFKSIAEKTKTDITEAKDEVSTKLTDIKDQVVKQNEKMVSEIRSEATKIVDSIITPVEEPTEVQKEKEQEKPKENEKEKEKEKEKVEIEIKNIQPIVMVVNEKKNNVTTEIVEKVNETLVKGDADVEVQSSNISTPPDDKMAVENKMTEDASDKSAQSNGGFPQSTSTTPKPPARTRKEVKKTQSNEETEHTDNADTPETTEPTKQPNLCQRLMGKCKTKCCPCCIKGVEENAEEEEMTDDAKEDKAKKMSIMDKINCCKKKKEEEETIRNLEEAAGKASIEFESETKRKPKLRDVLCGCCGRRRRVSDTSMPQNMEAMSPVVPLTPSVVGDTGCCGRRKSQVERRDSILSDRPPNSCCNMRLCRWVRGACRRRSEHSSSRRTSEFSKNKSLSPTLPPEDTRKKLDTSLVEHTSVMRGAIPVLPIALAYFCLFCNVIVPGLGTIFSGLFCLCFGIPRFGVHDGAKHRMGSFVINLLVGCGQLFTVLFCLVGWGWSIWWGVIMVKTARKYRKLKAEAALEEGEAQPPVTANNHTRA
ncbi:protein stum [Manduca sexta]|uniref:protein stum n=1 Tax=Manduca sexta TaxID=7130 RepID=UPI00188EB4E3|nr:protein stum [Manduca sexta]